MEIIRWIQSGQSLASIIEFEAIDYVFGKKKMSGNVQNSLEHASVCFNFQTTLCLENRLPETVTCESEVA